MAQSITPPLRYLGSGRPWPASFSIYSNKFTSYYFYSELFTDQVGHKFVRDIQLSESFWKDECPIASVQTCSKGPSSSLLFNVYLYGPLFRFSNRYFWSFLLQQLAKPKMNFSYVLQNQVLSYTSSLRCFGLGLTSTPTRFRRVPSTETLFDLFFSYLRFYHQWVSFFAISIYFKRYYSKFLTASVDMNFIFIRRYWVSASLVAHRVGIFLTNRRQFHRIFYKLKNFITGPSFSKMRSDLDLRSISFRLHRRRPFSSHMVQHRSLNFFNELTLTKKFKDAEHANFFFDSDFRFLPAPPSRLSFFWGYDCLYHISPFSTEECDADDCDDLGESSFSDQILNSTSRSLSFCTVSYLFSLVFRPKFLPLFNSDISIPFSRNLSSPFVPKGALRYRKKPGFAHVGLLGLCVDARGRFSKRQMAERNKINYGFLGVSAPCSTVDYILETPTLRNGACGLSGFVNASIRLSPLFY